MEGSSRQAPIYLLAGGPGSRRSGADPLLTHVLASSGVDHPSVAYIGAASGDNRMFFAMLARHLRRCGAREVTLAPLVGRAAKAGKARAILEAADVILMSGGDVEAGMRVLEERQLVPFLRGLYEAGKPFFGISAGSIMLARQWVRWAGADDATAEPFPCMGLVPLLCDTHGEAEDWEELRTLLQFTPEGTIGHGIPTGAALAVHPDGRLEALGAPVQRFARGAGGVDRLPDLG